MAASLRTLRFANPLYRLSLLGAAPAHLSRLPPEPWSGNAAIGQRILAGNLRCLGQAIDPDRPEWFSTARAPLVTAELNGFGWLYDLAAAGGAKAQAQARDLISGWLDEEQGWHAVAWRADVLGRRCTAWLAHARFLSRGQGDTLGPKLLGSLARQFRHLVRVAATEAAGTAQLAAIQGVLYGALCGLGRAQHVGRGLDLLRRALNQQMLPDGGHVERSPELTLLALRIALEIRDMLAVAQETPPSELAAAIAAWASTLRFLRHGDGGLALFNGSNEERAALIDAALKRCRADPAVPFGPRAGFHRLAAGKTMLLVDAAPPPPRGCDAHAHAGPLSFEMSVGKARLIVNCGAACNADPVWRRAQRATAAHSTLVVDDTNAAEVLVEDGLGRRPAAVTCARDEADGAMWLDLCHDGYAERFGLVHRRRIYLSADGDDVRGEDVLAGPHRGAFALRFHLHPDVQASVIQNGAAALLRLPGKDHWRLQVSGGELQVSESIYLGRRGDPRRSEQVVVQRRLDGGGANVKWALKRVAKV